MLIQSLSIRLLYIYYIIRQKSLVTRNCLPEHTIMWHEIKMSTAPLKSINTKVTSQTRWPWFPVTVPDFGGLPPTLYLISEAKILLILMILTVETVMSLGLKEDSGKKFPNFDPQVFFLVEHLYFYSKGILGNTHIFLDPISLLDTIMYPWEERPCDADLFVCHQCLISQIPWRNV